MHHFTIRNSYPFKRYALIAWAYFLRNDTPGIRITIRKNNIFVHTERAYNVILNDLRFALDNAEYDLECSKKDKEWLLKFTV